MNISYLKITVAVLLLGVQCRTHGHLRNSLHHHLSSEADPTLAAHNVQAASQWVRFTPGEVDKKSDPQGTKEGDDDPELARLRAENAKLKEEVQLYKENAQMKQLLTASDKLVADSKVAGQTQSAFRPEEPVYLKMQKKTDQNQAATTTAAFSWPSEEAASAGAATTTAAASSSSDSTATTAAPAASSGTSVSTEVEISTGVSNGTNITNVTIIKPCPNITNVTAAPTTNYNATEVIDKLKQRAQLSAEAAQAALEAINKIGRNSSVVANQAFEIANQAGKIWEHLMTNSVRTEEETLAAAEQLAAMKRINRMASNDYSKAVLKVHDFAPRIPAVMGASTTTLPAGMTPQYTSVNAMNR